MHKAIAPSSTSLPSIPASYSPDSTSAPNIWSSLTSRLSASTFPNRQKILNQKTFVLTGSYCRFYNIATHDGMGIGFYLTGRSAHNIISNCDAYNNFDSVNISVNNGGNSDGFGCHVSANCEGKRF